MENHVQCHLAKKDRHQIAWIPLDEAKLNGYVRLRTDGEWEDGWFIVEVGVTQLPSAWVRERSQDYTKMRGVTDI